MDNFDYNIDEDDFPFGLPDEVVDTLHPKKHSRDVLVEDCYALSLSDLGKGLLRPTNPWLEDYAKPFDLEIKPIGKSGVINLTNRNGGILTLRYKVDLEEPILLDISGHWRNSLLSQVIYLEEAMAPHGIRPYLLCPCGYRANKLYLSPYSHSFMCRRCAGLYYESTTINKNTTVGALGHALFRLFKVDEQKPKVKRITYAGKYTKKAERLLRLMGKYSAASLAQKVNSGQVQP